MFLDCFTNSECTHKLEFYRALLFVLLKTHLHISLREFRLFNQIEVDVVKHEDNILVFIQKTCFGYFPCSTSKSSKANRYNDSIEQFNNL